MLAVLRVAAPAALALTVLLLLAPSRAMGQTTIVDELKVGALAHDVAFFTHHVESGTDLNVELLFTAPDLLSLIGSPRPHLGADINTSGNTSDGYFGLTWGLPMLPRLFGGSDRVYFNGSLGGAVQDGFTGTQATVPPPGRKLLGSTVLLRESVELGYQLTPIFGLSAIIDHISNANLAPRNAGLTNAGARLGVKF